MRFRTSLRKLFLPGGMKKSQATLLNVLSLFNAISNKVLPPHNILK